MSNSETLKTPQVGGSALNDGLYIGKKMSDIEKMILNEIGYMPENEADAVNYLRKFIRKSYQYVKKCGANPDDQLFDD